MNERIDEILWQAGGYTKLNYPNDTFLDGRYALTQLQLDKFAELIVVKCANVVWDEAEKVNSPEINEVGYKLLDSFGIKR